jgi:quinolinate synthase
MAETAKVLNPAKRVYIPVSDATCPMASSLIVADIKRVKKEHPGVPVVLYVNTNVKEKAEADIVCTSANADKVVNSVPGNDVIFGPDRNLAWFVSQRSKKRIIPVPDDGYCYVHTIFTPEHVNLARKEHPSALLVVHPECVPEVQKMADSVASTGGMVKLAKSSKNKEFVLGTETGIIYRLKKENPSKSFYPLAGNAICKNMKKNTLQSVLDALNGKGEEIVIEQEIIYRAKSAVERMLKLK